VITVPRKPRSRPTAPGTDDNNPYAKYEPLSVERVSLARSPMMDVVTRNPPPTLQSKFKADVKKTTWDHMEVLPSDICANLGSNILWIGIFKGGTMEWSICSADKPVIFTSSVDSRTYLFCLSQGGDDEAIPPGETISPRIQLVIERRTSADTREGVAKKVVTTLSVPATPAIFQSKTTVNSLSSLGED